MHDQCLVLLKAIPCPEEHNPAVGEEEPPAVGEEEPPAVGEEEPPVGDIPPARDLTLSEQCAIAKEEKKAAQQILKNKATNQKNLDKKRQRVMDSIRKLSDEDIEAARLERAVKPKAKPKPKAKGKAKAKAKAMA